MEPITSNALLTADQMQQVDRNAASQGFCTYTSMQRAGMAVADGVRTLMGDPCKVLVLIGPGNNGGDGAIAAVELLAHGYEVELVSISNAPAEGSDAFRAYQQWQQSTPAMTSSDTSWSSHQLEIQVESAAVIIDAMFGAGLSRPLSSSLEQLVNLINSSSAKVVAVDVPSGLNGNTHCIHGACIQADMTVTFFLRKPAHVLFPGRKVCGKLLLAQIGLSAEQLGGEKLQCWLNGPALFKDKLPHCEVNGHKFNRGHVLVRSGPVQSTGAARLCAETALYSGAGLVTVATTTEAMATNAAHLTAVMLQQIDTQDEWAESLTDHRINTVAVGPGNGLSEQTRQCVIASLQAEKHCVLDADALSCWQDPEHNSVLIRSLKLCSPTTVLTPHAGEFKRLFGEFLPEKFPSKLHQTREAARLVDSIIVYKGADTVIAAPDGRASINANAPPWLATAGAGDVLAGLIAALLAQGTPAFEAACAAVWLHGAAAENLGYPLCAEDMVRQVGRELGHTIAMSW